MSKTSNPTIIPSAGYILAQPYIQEDKIFRSLKENTGEDVFSVVIAVGDAVKDEKGQMRFSPCKIGDVVISTDSNKTFDIEHIKHRFIHFTEVHGIWKTKKTKE